MEKAKQYDLTHVGIKNEPDDVIAGCVLVAAVILDYCWHRIRKAGQRI